jgi:hypothetical protein
MHKTTNTKTEDEAAYYKMRFCEANITLGDKLPQLHVIGYSNSWVLVYCKLGGTVDQVARKCLIKETTPQVSLQAILTCCDIIFPQERAMKTLANIFCEMYEC